MITEKSFTLPEKKFARNECMCRNDNKIDRKLMLAFRMELPLPSTIQKNEIFQADADENIDWQSVLCVTLLCACVSGILLYLSIANNKKRQSRTEQWSC